jgi:hypothetical protein
LIRLTITPAACAVIVATHPASAGLEQNSAPNGEFYVWLEPIYVDRPRAPGGPGETYGDVDAVWLIIDALLTRIRRGMAVMVLKAFPLEYEGEITAENRTAFARRQRALIRLYERRLEQRGGAAHVPMRPPPNSGSLLIVRLEAASPRQAGWRLGLDPRLSPISFATGYDAASDRSLWDEAAAWPARCVRGAGRFLTEPLSRRRIAMRRRFLEVDQTPALSAFAVAALTFGAASGPDVAAAQTLTSTGVSATATAQSSLCYSATDPGQCFAS